MLETSEPASGSVSANEESLYSSVIIERYSRLSSSDPARRIGVAASPLAPSEVWMPEQPQASSSCTTTPSNEDSATPPYSSGVWMFMSPTSHALRRTSSGQVPSRSYSAATGRISRSAKSWASSRSAFVSSDSRKSTMHVSSEPGGRLTRQSIVTDGAHEWFHPAASGTRPRMARALRRFELDDLVVRPGTYVHPETEILIVVDDSADIGSEVFEGADDDEGEWVLVSDEAPVDEHRRDELVHDFQARYDPAGGRGESGDDAVEEDDEEELETLDPDEES